MGHDDAWKPLAVAACLLGAIAGLACDSKGGTSVEGTHSEPSGWARLASPPDVPEGSTLLAAGDRLLLAGGCAHDYRRHGGCGRSRRVYSFTPGTSGWAELPPSPEGISGPGVWTGEEAVFLDLSGRRPTTGMSYDPDTDSWSEIPEGPTSAATAEAVWAGDEVVVWGGRARNGSGGVIGAAYDPAEHAWSRIATAPISLNQFDLVWTGSEMIAFGSRLDRRNWSGTNTAIGAAYDPATDTWRRLPPSDLNPQATTASWFDGALIAYGYDGHSQAYVPDRPRWQRTQKMPLDFSECYPDSIASESELTAFYCGQIVTLDSADGRWKPLEGGLTERIHRNGQIHIPVWRFSLLAALGDTTYFLAEGVTFGGGGTTRYNFPESPHSFWSYR
jgi:hypothetical protein